MKLDPTKLARITAAVDSVSERIDYWLSERLPAPQVLRRADKTWDESKHPRGPDGKFVEGEGAAAASAAEYLAQQQKAGKKATPNGMMQHLLLNGGITKQEIWETTKANFEMAPHLNNYVSAVAATMKKKGIDVPEPPKAKKGGDKAEAKKEEPKDEPKKEAEPSATPDQEESYQNWMDTVGKLQSETDIKDAYAGIDYAKDKGFITAAQHAKLAKAIENQDLAIHAPPEQAPGNEPAEDPDLTTVTMGGQGMKQEAFQKWKAEASAPGQTADELNDYQAGVEYAKSKGHITEAQAKEITEAIAEAKKKLAGGAPATGEEAMNAALAALPNPKNTQEDDIAWLAKNGTYTPEEKIKYLNEMAIASPSKPYLEQALAAVKLGLKDQEGSAPAAGQPTAEQKQVEANWKVTIENIKSAQNAELLASSLDHAQSLGKLTPEQVVQMKADLAAKGASLGGGTAKSSPGGEGLPEPGMSPLQQSLHDMVAEGNNYEHENMATLINEYLVAKSPGDKEYIGKLLEAIGGEIPEDAAPEAPAKLPKLPNKSTGAMNAAHDIANKPHLSTQEKLGQLKAMHDNLSSADNKAYVAKLMKALGGDDPGKPAKLPKPSKGTSQAQKDIYAIATNPNLSSQEKMKQLVDKHDNFSLPHNKEYAAKLIQALGGQAPAAPLPKPPPKPLAQTAELQTELSDLKEKWKGVLASNKAPVDAIAEQLDKALALPTGDDQAQALSKITPIPSPVGMGQQSANTFLAKAQQAAGINPTTPGHPSNAPLSSSLPKGPGKKLQSEIFHALEDSPSVFIEQVAKFEGAQGKIKARNVIDTDLIPKDQYAKITAAYGANRDDGMTQAVDKAMADYSAHSFGSLDQETKDAVASYQGHGYQAINGALLAGTEGSGQTKTKIQKIKKAIENSVVPADTPAFRGMRCSLKDLSGFDDPAKSVGRAFVHKNFASISRSQQKARDFGEDVMLKMTIPAGTRGLVMGKQNWEREIMLQANSVFRIDKVEQKVTPSGKAQHFVHVTYMGTKEDA